MNTSTALHYAALALPFVYFIAHNVSQRPPPPPERVWLTRLWKLSEFAMILPWDQWGGAPSLPGSINPPPPEKQSYRDDAQTKPGAWK